MIREDKLVQNQGKTKVRKKIKGEEFKEKKWEKRIKRNKTEGTIAQTEVFISYIVGGGQVLKRNILNTT